MNIDNLITSLTSKSMNNNIQWITIPEKYGFEYSLRTDIITRKNNIKIEFHFTDGKDEITEASLVLYDGNQKTVHIDSKDYPLLKKLAYIIYMNRKNRMDEVLIDSIRFLESIKGDTDKRLPEGYPVWKKWYKKIFKKCPHHYVKFEGMNFCTICSSFK
jgi:hypothetical protein